MSNACAGLSHIMSRGGRRPHRPADGVTRNPAPITHKTKEARRRRGQFASLSVAAPWKDATDPRLTSLASTSNIINHPQSAETAPAQKQKEARRTQYGDEASCRGLFQGTRGGTSYGL